MRHLCEQGAYPFEQTNTIMETTVVKSKSLHPVPGLYAGINYCKHSFQFAANLVAYIVVCGSTAFITHTEPCTWIAPRSFMVLSDVFRVAVRDFAQFLVFLKFVHGVENLIFNILKEIFI